MDDHKIYNCHFELALDVFSGKWKLLILYHIMQNSVLRNGQLKSLIPEINERVLNRQLQSLEEDKIINRKVYPEIPPKVEYSLTDIGKKIVPIIQMLESFGKDYTQLKDDVTVRYV